MSKPPIRVRMYKELLGDCFLLTIGDPKAPRDKRVHILIDCGILQQVPGEAKLIKAAAEDIFTVTGGRLDLLVITHEHWDHISGFVHARQRLIDEMQIEWLWLAWTERRGDPQADPLRAKSAKAKGVVARAAAFAARANVNATAGIERFSGPLAAGKLTSLDVIPELIKRAEKTGKVGYLEPGTVHITPGPHGLRAHVLGPSRNPDYLTKSQPPGVGKQTYLAEEFALALDERYAAAESLAEAFKPGGPSPFARNHAIEVDRVNPAPHDKELEWLWNRYNAPAEEWRNIDHAWLGAAGSLALKLDNDTNNTSLVLALEIEPGGDVLLFAADAQVGNWMSWHKQNYPSPVAGAPDVTATDLLGRTTLYKVGHHASHNATLDKQGLALMTHSDLVAMIPVVEAEARREKNGKAVHRGWDMPYPDLLRRLMERTKGRILRGDAKPGQDAKGDTICTDKDFLSRVSAKDLFVEYRVR